MWVGEVPWVKLLNRQMVVRELRRMVGSGEGRGMGRGVGLLMNGFGGWVF